MILLQRIYRNVLIVLLPLAAASALYEWKKLPLGIFLGGVLGLLNLKGLAWGLRDFAAAQRPSGKVIFLSMLRFFALAFILIILVVERIVNPVGILIGFTVVFAFVIKEGLKFGKSEEAVRKGNAHD